MDSFKNESPTFLISSRKWIEGSESNEWNMWEKLREQTSTYKISHGDVKYSIGNTVNNIWKALYGDRG